MKLDNIDTLVVDVDGTLCYIEPDGNYSTVKPIQNVIDKVNECFNSGKYIILFTARGMRTFKGNVHEIDKHHRPILTKWLIDNGVKYHELHFGKPWNRRTAYLDDNALTIEMFLENE